MTVIADNQGIGSGPGFSFSAHLFMDPDDANSVFALAVDASSSRLLRIDLNSGDRSELMDLREHEPIIPGVYAAAHDPAGRRLFLSSADVGKFVIVDLDSLQRQPLSLSLPLGNFPQGMVYEPSGDDLLFTMNDGSARRLYRHDLSTQTTEVVSGESNDGGKGAGPGFQYLRGITLRDNDTAFVSDSEWNTLFTVNLANGDRQVIMPHIGEGPNWSVPDDIVASVDGKALRVLDRRGGIVNMPLDGGAREILVSQDAFSRPVEYMRGDDDGTLYAITDRDELYVISTAGEVTQPPSTPRVAFDNHPYLPDFAVDADAGAAWFIVEIPGDGIDNIGRFDLATGQGEIVFHGASDFEAPLKTASKIVRDPVSGKLIIWHRDAIVLADPASGQTEWRPLETTSLQVDAMKFVPEENALIVSVPNAIYRIDMDDGSWTELAPLDVGNRMSGMSYFDPFVYDSKRKVIYLASDLFDAIFMIDLVSGDEVILAR